MGCLFPTCTRLRPPGHHNMVTTRRNTYFEPSPRSPKHAAASIDDSRREVSGSVLSGAREIEQRIKKYHEKLAQRRARALENEKKLRSNLRTTWTAYLRDTRPTRRKFGPKEPALPPSVVQARRPPRPIALPAISSSRRRPLARSEAERENQEQRGSQRRTRYIPSHRQPPLVALPPSLPTIEDLDILTLPDLNQKQPLSKALSQLRWSIDLSGSRIRFPIRNETARSPTSLPGPLDQSRPPAEYDDDLIRETIRVGYRFQDAPLQVPSNWTPICQVPLDKFTAGTIISEPNRRGYAWSDLEDQDTPQAKNRSLWDNYSVESTEADRDTDISTDLSLQLTRAEEVSLHYHPSETKKLEAIHDWQLGRERDTQRHTGAFHYNDSSRNTDCRFSNAGSRLLLFRTMDMRDRSEVHLRSYIARVISDVWSTDVLPTYRSLPLPRWPLKPEILLPLTVDIACIPTSQALPWHSSFAPVLMAAHGGQIASLIAAETLAVSFHTAMILFILYYLDTRKAASDKLPSWMVLYGVIFDHNGFQVQRYYPVYVQVEDDRSEGWGAASYPASTIPSSVFEAQSRTRSQAAATLLRISSHARFVMSQLAAWDGYSRILGCRLPAPLEEDASKR
ncbi:hypothetical protein PIIN_09753 [Serendipita indica DSM 11827]|uniref:Uncharacterized protein n=1 Tax=Serendipita indica (strain DSM 11827) TaxID=1109443 RepID=G4TWS0_SERID|nr:hypothetical protein PIIN_09753 [Serendipita indica DSM 11827]